MASLAPDKVRIREPIVLAVLYDPTDQGSARAVNGLIEHFQGSPTTNLDRGMWISVLPVPAEMPPSLDEMMTRIGDPRAVVVVSLLQPANAEGPGWKAFWQELRAVIQNRWGRAGKLLPLLPNQTPPADPLRSLTHMRIAKLDDDGMLQLLRVTSLTCAQAVRFAVKREDPANSGLSDFKVDRQQDQIFISHSKHDSDSSGVKIALKIRDAIASRSDVSIFFDVANIRPGEEFEETILEEVAESLLVAVHTDTYSSREWCRKEVLTAKKHDRPAIVAGCVRDLDQRSFPYLGNTPYVSLRPLNKRRVESFVLRIFDEMLRHYVWLGRVGQIKARNNIYYLSRPPELISIASTLAHVNPNERSTIVYPDPPIGDEEKGLIEALRKDLSLLSFTEWRALQ